MATHLEVDLDDTTVTVFTEMPGVEFGVPGLPGPPGPTGPVGPAGSEVNWRGAWSVGIDYAPDDAVSYQGSSWIARLNPPMGAIPSGASAYWQLLAAQGAEGPQGVQGPQGNAGPVGPAGLNWAGNWSASVDYVADDAVGYDGSSWFASGNPPVGEVPSVSSSYWQLLTSEGAPGIQGPQGLQGIQGVPGATGATGSAGGSTSIFKYRARTGVTSGDPSPGKIIWNHATQTSATVLNFDITDDSGLDVSIGLASLVATNKLYLQEYDNAANFQEWTVSSVTPQTGYYQVAVTLSTSGGAGSSGFTNGLMLAVRVVRPGPQGPTGPTGPAGATGPAGVTKVTHGSDPDVARPSATIVYWVGSVEPVNGLPDDWLLLGT